MWHKASHDLPDARHHFFPLDDQAPDLRTGRSIPKPRQAFRDARSVLRCVDFDLSYRSGKRGARGPVMGLRCFAVYPAVFI